MRTNLDMDVLRTLVAAKELGGLNRAAGQIGRSQSAVSQQIRKLEEQVGQPLFRKEGRGVALTEAGESVLAYARRILDLNDEAVPPCVASPSTVPRGSDCRATSPRPGSHGARPLQTRASCRAHRGERGPARGADRPPQSRATRSRTAHRHSRAKRRTFSRDTADDLDRAWNKEK